MLLLKKYWIQAIVFFIALDGRSHLTLEAEITIANKYDYGWYKHQYH